MVDGVEKAAETAAAPGATANGAAPDGQQSGGEETEEEVGAPSFEDFKPGQDPPWCLGRGCPWCFLGLEPADHGDLRAAAAAVHGMSAWQLQQPGHISHENLTWPFSGMGLAAVAMCAAQALLLTPGDQTDQAIRKLRCHNMLRGSLPPGPPNGAPPGLGSGGAFGDVAHGAHQHGSASTGPWAAGQPGSSGDNDAAGASAEGGPRKAKKKKQRHWWTDDDTAEWRQAVYVMNDPMRSRAVKVKGDGNEWITLDARPTQQILEWYDRTFRGSILKNVGMPNGHVYDYRFEGGGVITQWSPMHTDSKPREVKIVYCELWQDHRG